MNPPDFTSLTDHDLLITLIGEVKALRDDLKRTSDASALITSDHETRIRSLERARWTVAGAAGILGAGITLGANYLMNK